MSAPGSPWGLTPIGVGVCVSSCPSFDDRGQLGHFCRAAAEMPVTIRRGEVCPVWARRERSGRSEDLRRLHDLQAEHGRARAALLLAASSLEAIAVSELAAESREADPAGLSEAVALVARTLRSALQNGGANGS